MKFTFLLLLVSVSLYTGFTRYDCLKNPSNTNDCIIIDNMELDPYQDEFQEDFEEIIIDNPDYPSEPSE